MNLHLFEMVIDKVENSTSSSSSGVNSQNNQKKIFSCAEIETQARKNETKHLPKPSPKINLKLVDPAIMHLSSPNEPVRYLKTELESLKNSRLSSSPPSCFFDPKVKRMNILIDKQPVDLEKQMKAFREMLPSLSVNTWDPKLFELLNNYHRSLLYPQFDYMNNNYNNLRSPRTINQNFNRRVSWGDQKQFLDNQQKKIPSYESKNFFDNITTTTTMRPPKMGVGSLGYQKNQRQPQQPVRSAKGNPCSNERFSYYPNNFSGGSASLNETKSSYDESMEKSTEKTDSEFNMKMNFRAEKKVDNEESSEPEPEWFSWPASRSDVIELHGFEEEESLHPNTPLSVDGSEREEQPRQEVEMPNYRQNQIHNSNRFPRNFNPSVNNMNNSSSSSDYHPRYRNPLHNSRSSSSSFSSFNRSDPHNMSNISSDMEGMTINPFFEMWKRKNIQQENVNFMSWVNPVEPMRTISDVETSMKQNVPYYPQQHQQQQQMYNAPFRGNLAMQQFFQCGQYAPQNHVAQAPMNSGIPQPFVGPTTNFRPGTIPTAEELHRHTSQIMRNAMLRRQYYNEKKFPE